MSALAEARKWVVIEYRGDGSRAWGPFSEHNALIAADALRECGDYDDVAVMPLHPKSFLDIERPDWKRGVRV